MKLLAKAALIAAIVGLVLSAYWVHEFLYVLGRMS